MKKTQQQHLLTAEGESLLSCGRIPWDTHPRPLMQRDSFFCLNGMWQFSARADGDFDEEIRVPFAPESLLSGICRRLGKNPVIRYRRTFSLPENFRPAYPHRVLLHFDAVDQIASVSLNHAELGTHKGGYEPFAFDITEALEAENTLTVMVRDELHRKILPYGKQCEKRGGMWYTPVTGIWQTVWLECVPEQYVRTLTIRIGADSAEITAEGAKHGEIVLTTPDGEECFPLENERAVIRPSAVRPWSPEDPYLYRFTLHTGDDCIRSYFALRTLSVQSVGGIERLCLNGKPIFLHALLDQGYWSDGIFTPASPASYEKDILSAKALGFNTLRKHIKIEPQRFYYDCDRLGMLVMQDFVNNGSYSFLRDTALPTLGLKKLPSFLLHRPKAVRDAFREAMCSSVRALFAHPSVIYWTIFNEGWGQSDSARIYDTLYSLDDSRFIDTASGWFSSKNLPTDTESLHVYFKPVKLKKSDKPIVLSEFGGYSFKPAGHVFNPAKTYGYRFFSDRQTYEDALVKLYEEEILPAVSLGLCGAVYTQLTDVEDETNGLYSYDRKICKVDAERICRISKQLTGYVY
ncbi:MAG: glycoside hydrolase family 2 [Clostridia bacterium]|nr:glycoside hydrolase family 2 [Clostridia bacterium]